MASVASSAPDLRHRQLIVASAQANETRVGEILAEDPFWASHTDRDALRQALQKAAARGSLAVTRLLLDRGADVEPRRDSETAALFRAAESGHVDVAAELLARGANANVRVRSRLDQTPLFQACLRGHNKVVAVLLDHGANVNLHDKEGRTPLLLVALEKQVEQDKKGTGVAETVRLLIGRGGADPDQRDHTGRTPLLWAAANGNIQLVHTLLDATLSKTANVLAVNNRSRTALHLAAGANQEEMVQLLLRYGADANAVSDGGWTPLHNAAQNGHTSIAALLLAAHANVNVELSNGMTPLHWAAFNGHKPMVRLLLECPETYLDCKDSFDRTPMLCAAERFHRDIVHILSPIHAASRLSPAALEACNNFKASIVDFGNFRDGKKHLVQKISVFDVLYGWDNDTGKPKVETVTSKIKYQPEFRWIHLPANNIAWAHALLSKWFIEGGHRDIGAFKALEKCFDQEHRGPLAHAHYMRTFCHHIPSMRYVSTAVDKEGPEEPTCPSPGPDTVAEGTSIGSAALESSASLTGAYVRNGSSKRAQAQDSQSDGSGRPEITRRKGKGELIAERHPRRAKRTNGPPGNPPGTKALRARASGQVPVVWETAKLPPSSGKIVLFMPFLHYETDERRQQMSHTIELVRQGQELPADSPSDAMLVKGYLHNMPPLHPRRTLDQFFYHGIDTSVRDMDQVVYRYCRQHNIEKKVYMVDQLWLWVLGKDLVVTCFPQRWNQPTRDPLNVVDSIIEETNAKTRPPIQSVYDLAMLITNRCSCMFDRYRLHDQDYQFLDMFESSVGSATNTESELFRRFNKASEMSTEWLELHRRPRRRLATSDLPSSTSVSSPSPGSHGTGHGESGKDRLDHSWGAVEGPVFPDALLDIGRETSLMAEIKDIRDELNILAVVLTSQTTSLEEFESHITNELRPEGAASSRRGGHAYFGGGIPAGAAGTAGAPSTDSIVSEVRKRSREQMRLLEIRRKDIDRMIHQVESIYTNLTHLLDLKQKHSNALEARFARDHAMIAARQGQTIMTFTIVTIVFLPMSFIASFFAINFKDWNGGLTVPYVSKYMFGIGLGISIPLIVMAFTVADILDAVHGIYAFSKGHFSLQYLIPWRFAKHSHRTGQWGQQQGQDNSGNGRDSDFASSVTAMGTQMPITGSSILAGRVGGVDIANKFDARRPPWGLDRTPATMQPSSDLDDLHGRDLPPNLSLAKSLPIRNSVNSHFAGSNRLNVQPGLVSADIVSAPLTHRQSPSSGEKGMLGSERRRPWTGEDLEKGQANCPPK